MDRFYILIILVLIIILEIGIKFYEMMKLQDRISFLNEFNDKFVEYCNGKGKNNDLYTWLIRKSNKMQSEIGIFGIVDYKAPYTNHIINNFQLILNGLPKTRDDFINNPGSQHAVLVNEALLRYGGWLEELVESLRKTITNPFILLIDGIKSILSLPILILHEIKLLPVNIYQKLRDNIIDKFLAGIITLISIVSGIITIFTGWKPLIDTILNLF